MFDKDKSGRISKTELKDACEQLKVSITDDELNKVFEEVTFFY